MQNVGDAFRASSMAHWRLHGRDGLVKVMNEDSARHMRLSPDLARVRVKGYIGIAKYIYGLNAQQIERALGLPPHCMANGAYVYCLDRLPAFSEVDFKFSLAWPDGKVPAPAEYMDMLKRRDAAYAGLTSEPSLYPPGGGHIPQWRLNFDRGHSGIPGSLIQVVTATEPFKREGGSAQPYHPHKRPPNWGKVL